MRVQNPQFWPQCTTIRDMNGREVKIDFQGVFSFCYNSNNTYMIINIFTFPN